MFVFDYDKGIQILNYYSNKNNKKINYMKALKLIFFADRYHLRKYGRFVSGANYIGMKYGPVASEIKDIIDTDEIYDEDLWIKKNNYISKEHYDIISLKEIDYDEFSETDMEALEFSWKTFKKFDEFLLAELTHNFPEWYYYKNYLNNDNSKRFQMNIIDFFHNPEGEYLENLKKVFGKDPFDVIPNKFVEFNKELIESQLVINN